MTKKCPVCKHDFDGNAKKKYCSKKCKKKYENSLRSVPQSKQKSNQKQKSNPPSQSIECPQWLNDVAADYWNRISPVVHTRGHLNIISADAFAELCDTYSRLIEVNKAIDETNNSLLQIVEQWDNKNGTETKQFKESALSDLKRKYSKLFLDYQRQFYLTPLSNRGDFGLGENEPKEDEKNSGSERFFKD